ncbi:MAG: hypothetical protein ABI343_15710, partial [Burkholderiaceae bacterium]
EVEFRLSRQAPLAAHVAALFRFAIPFDRCVTSVWRAWIFLLCQPPKTIIRDRAFEQEPGSKRLLIAGNRGNPDLRAGFS